MSACSPRLNARTLRYLAAKLAARRYLDGAEVERLVRGSAIPGIAEDRRADSPA